MKLSIPILGGKKEKTEYFLALLLRDTKASAVILEETGKKLKIISSHEEYFTTSIEDAPFEEWLQVLDKTISQAEETLPPTIESHKTVFGVKDSWIEEKKIKKDYLVKLKKVCESLDLSPIGFLIISEAIAHLIQDEEGAPLTAILAEVTKSQVTISLFRAGKLTETKHKAITTSPAEITDNLLREFETVEVLPSRIILFDGSLTEDLAQQFIIHKWSKSLPFLHMPQISILPQGFDAKGVVFGAATQMGFEVLNTGEKSVIKTFASTVEEEQKEDAEEEPFISSEVKPMGGHVVIPAEPEDEKQDTEKEASEKIGQTATWEFGFMTDQDVADLPRPESHPPGEDHESEGTSETHIPFSGEREHTLAYQMRGKSENSLEMPEKSATRQFPKFHLSGLKLPSLTFPPLPFLTGRNKSFILLPLVLLLLIGIIVLYVFMLHATVVLHLNPKQFSDTETISFSIDGNNDFSSNIIAAQKISTTLKGSVSTDTTGKKNIGDKATGTITIFNSSDNSQQLNAGTTITSQNGLNFTTDKDVTVASASGDIFSGIESGTTDVPVTASTFGTEYNLPSGTTFSLGGSSTLAGKNSNAFSGGTKKTIVIVTKADENQLLAQLPKSLEQQAKDALSKKISSDQTILPFILSESFNNKTFDKNIGDQSSTVTLNGSVSFSEAVYKNSDIHDFATTLMKNKSNSNLQLDEKGIQTSVANLKQKNDTTINAPLSLKAGLLPQIDQAKIIQEITGSSVRDATTRLSKLPQVESVDINLSPNIPFLPKFLPRIMNHITLTVDSNG